MPIGLRWKGQWKDKRRRRRRWIKMVNGDGWLDGTSTDWISRRIITDRSSGRLSCASTCGFYYSELALDNAAFSND